MGNYKDTVEIEGYNGREGHLGNKRLDCVNFNGRKYLVDASEKKPDASGGVPKIFSIAYEIIDSGNESRKAIAMRITTDWKLIELSGIFDRDNKGRVSNEPQRVTRTDITGLLNNIG